MAMLGEMQIVLVGVSGASGVSGGMGFGITSAEGERILNLVM